MFEKDTAFGLINLQALLDTILVEFEGDEGLFIPFRPNPSLTLSDRGVHLCVRISPLKNGKDNFGNSHVAYAAPSKDWKDVLSEEDKKIALPFLGKFYVTTGDTPAGTARTKSGVPIAKRIDTVSKHSPQNTDEYDNFPF